MADSRHRLEKSTTAVDAYKATLPGGQPQNAQQESELQKLITNELRAQEDLHDRLLAQRQAELGAARYLESYAGKISTHLKNHDQLVREAKDAALEHVRAAQQLNEEYLRIGVTVAGLKNHMRAAAEDLVTKTRDAADSAADSLLDQQRIQNESDQAAIQQQIDMLPYGGAGAITFSGPAEQGPRERAAREQAETESLHPGSKNANVEADRLKVALAALAVAIAQDVEDDKKKHLQAAQDAYDAVKSADNQKALTDAQNAYAQAIVDATKAQDGYTLATAKLIEDQQQKWDQLINGLVEKIGAPGLSVNANTAALSFDPTQLFAAALEQSQTFGDVMATVTQIVQTFAEAINAFRPVIDALLDVVRAVANVFIFLYNQVARLLELFGVQVQQLQYLNSAIGNLVPLIEIWHEIPTLNELAAGKLNSPLSTQPQGLQSVGGPGQGQNGLMKVVELLTGILVAIIVTKLIEGQSLAAAVQQTARMIGINVATQKSATEAPALSAQQKQAVMTASQNVNNIAMQVGAKASSAATVTNNLLSQILTAINSMVAQMSAANAGGFGGILKSIFGSAGGGSGGGLEGSGGVGLAVVGGGAPAVQQALQSFGDGIRNVVQKIQSLGASFDDLRGRMTRFGDALDAATSRASAFAGAGGGSLANISSALSLDTSRRIAVSGYGIDRVPGST